MKSLAVSKLEKTLDLEEFFNPINLRNNQPIQIKKNILQLLNELAENNIIQNEVEVALKIGKRKDQLIQNLTISDITRRIKYLKFYEILKILLNKCLLSLSSDFKFNFQLLFT
jgi:hypothetical protein